MSDIQELFDRDPLSLTREDLKPMVMFLREKLNAFNLGDKSAGSTKRLKKAASDSPKISNIDELLSDL